MSFLLAFGKTNPHAQRMECDSGTVRMVRDHSRTSTSVGTVAEEGEGQRQPGRCGSSTSRRSKHSRARCARSRWSLEQRRFSTVFRDSQFGRGSCSGGPRGCFSQDGVSKAPKRAKAQEGAPARIDRMPELVQPVREWRGWNRQLQQWEIARGQSWTCWSLH